MTQIAVEKWPALPMNAWEDTYATLHLWTQVVGKIRLASTPLVNHWWNITFQVTSRGFTTLPMVYQGTSFEIIFDFVAHELRIECADGRSKSILLQPRSVADFYQLLMKNLADLNIGVKIWTMPVELPNPIPFEKNTIAHAYDRDHAQRCWKILLQSHKVFTEFRSHFIGKCSPVHFFWGSFDLAVTRFSGRLAPSRDGADAMTREAYSHEVISHGFWPGFRPSESTKKPEEEVREPAFYAYAAPEPAGFSQAAIRPAKAFYHTVLKEYFLRYEDVRQSNDPEGMLMEFFQSTYEAGANLGKWDRASLERHP